MIAGGQAGEAAKNANQQTKAIHDAADKQTKATNNNAANIANTIVNTNNSSVRTSNSQGGGGEDRHRDAGYSRLAEGEIQ